MRYPITFPIDTQTMIIIVIGLTTHLTSINNICPTLIKVKTNKNKPKLSLLTNVITPAINAKLTINIRLVLLNKLALRLAATFIYVSSHKNK